MKLLPLLAILSFLTIGPALAQDHIKAPPIDPQTKAEMETLKAKIKTNADKMKAEREKLKPLADELKADRAKMKALREKVKAARDAHRAEVESKMKTKTDAHKAKLEATPVAPAAPAAAQ